MKNMRKTTAIVIAALMICSFAACSGQGKDTASSDSNTSAVSASDTASSGTGDTSAQESGASGEASQTASSVESISTEFNGNSSGKIDTTDLFTKRDLLQTPDLSGARTITASDKKTETISEEGTYIITGTASDFTVKVEADSKSKVQLVLDNLNVTNESAPVIYVVSADKCFVTTNGNESSLTVSGSFDSDGDTKTDAVIFAKDDLVLNGTGGTYKITSSGDSIEVKDSVSICSGTIEIESSKDGIQCKNKDDETKGAVYIAAATIRINAANDAVQAATVCQIDSGTLELSGNEGIESTYVQINGGEIVITATDDGINAGQKTNYSTPTIEINDGSIKITVGQGDTDAIDSNGDIIVNGGTIDITSTVSSFDYDGTAQYNGGTIIINGEQVDSIPQSTMGGGMGGMPGMQ